MSYELENLIISYFRDDKIKFNTICANCSKICYHLKNIKMSKLAKILFISIQRFDNVNKTKNNKNIYFKEYLNLEQFIDSDCYEEESKEYNLYAILGHTGTSDNGHYFSFIKLNNIWYVLCKKWSTPRGDQILQKIL